MARLSFSRRPSRSRPYQYQPVRDPQHLAVLHRLFRIPVIIPILLVLTLLAVGVAIMGESLASAATLAESHFQFSTVPGYFLQDDPNTDPEQFDYSATNFGLIPRAYDADPEFDPEQKRTQWERFASEVHRLNRDSPSNVFYKVLFLGRHGEGVHNVAEARYGTELWDCYWSIQDGDETGSWVDARLTDLGIAQAELAHRTWEKQIETGIPAPESYYVSPLNRCLATASITFKGLKMPLTDPFQPLVKENLRETLGLHTCDSRSSKTAIATEYPEYKIEPGFAETDPLYDPKLRESNSARDARLLGFLQDVFAHDDKSFLSMTAHSGAITSILEVTGHRVFALATGGVIPVLVRAERVEGPLPPREVEPPFPAPVCK
ncbi:histidine phosphatase superfamily [Aspergillus taichungensis]|uniref:Histidine phosphatase superfamily n=1 Tax=Aspergillus taichungensis TaxID=482145 RepID=A0A2J5HEC9_9EURO|nr:histidine phosphatase superfamily [Aspergillus taichungensis]